MKTTYSFVAVLIVFILNTNGANAQTEFWGTTSKSGTSGLGTVFKTNYNGEDFQIIHSFNTSYPGEVPQGEVIQAANGKLYGYTSGGGSCGYGTLFEYDINTGNFLSLFSFDFYSTGADPAGHPIQATNGKLYGVTNSGGPNDSGTLFEFDINSSSFVVLNDFSTFDFIPTPSGSLLEATNGKLYSLGTGGSGGSGVIFEYNINTNTVTKLFDFSLSGVQGYEPWGGLMEASNGKLYGTTSQGGANFEGVLFEFEIAGSIFTKKIDFNTTNGRYPYGDLMQATNGMIYGHTGEGGSGFGGTLFEYNPVSNILVNRIEFDGTVGDSPLFGAPCEASNGKIYGMTSVGGLNYYSGSLYEYDPINQIADIKIEFDGFNGNYPSGGLLHASNGKIYGLTDGGGTPQSGNLFEYDYVNDLLISIVELNETIDGSSPSGGLTLASNGKLYGLTLSGGDNAVGAVIEIDPLTNVVTTAASFSSTNGGYTIIPGSPNTEQSELCEASNGKLYGVSANGGSNGSGAIFEFDPTTNSISLKASFNSATTGYSPKISLMEASNGLLYGVATSGGANGKGTLFSFNTTSGALLKIYDFNNTLGTFPACKLSELSPGRIFGTTTSNGQNGVGSIFVFDINSATTTKTLDFTAVNGSLPGTIFSSDNGSFYIMFSFDGANGNGTICSYDTTSQTLTKLYDFNANTGLTTYYGQLTEINNKLYALKYVKDNSPDGDLFEFDISTNTLIGKQELSCENGSLPNTSTLTKVDKQSESLVWPGDCNYDLQVDNLDFLYLGLAFGNTGGIRAGASNNWIGQAAPAWSNAFNTSVNHKHADCNGDGNVEVTDSTAISLNYSQSHPLRISNTISSSISGDLTLVASSTVIAPGSSVIFDIILDNAGAPISNLYGISFTLNFDPTLIDSNQLYINWSPSVLGLIGTDAEGFQKYYPSNGQLHAALCRTNQIDATNVNGIIGQLNVVASASVPTLSNLIVTPSLITGITVGEELQSFNSFADSSIIDPSLIGLEESENNYISIYPNPASTSLSIHSNLSYLNQVTVYDSKGVIYFNEYDTNSNKVITTTNWPCGIYFVDLIAPEKIMHKKIMIFR